MRANRACLIQHLFQIPMDLADLKKSMLQKNFEKHYESFNWMYDKSYISQLRG